MNIHDDLMKREKGRAEEERAFQDFLASPLAQLSISLIPETNPPELLQKILRAAFNAGRANGQVQVISELVDIMAKREGDRKS